MDEEIPDWPWFTVNLGDAELVAEYLADTAEVRLRTFDFTTLVLTGCERGAEAVWAAIIKIAISQDLNSLRSIE